MTQNPSITWKIIIDNIDIYWDWNYLSGSDKISWDIVKNNIDLPWCWYELSKNSIINTRIISNNMNYPWCWYNGVSKNKNISIIYFIRCILT